MLGENHSNCRARSVFGRLIRMRASPHDDAGAIALYRGPSCAARRFKSPEHRFGGNTRRIASQYTPYHRAFQELTIRTNVGMRQDHPPALPITGASCISGGTGLRPGRCRSSVVEHPLGKGEVVGSIPTGSTIFFSRIENRL